jgi:hypothetical protein
MVTSQDGQTTRWIISMVSRHTEHPALKISIIRLVAIVSSFLMCLLASSLRRPEHTLHMHCAFVPDVSMHSKESPDSQRESSRTQCGFGAHERPYKHEAYSHYAQEQWLVSTA